MKYKFKDIIVYQNVDSKGIYLAVSKAINSGREDTFVSGEKKLRYTVTASSVSYVVHYDDPEEAGCWRKFAKNSVTERLLGVTYDDEQEFTWEELKALQTSLNAAQQHAYRRAYNVNESGTGDFESMKEGDLLFALEGKDFVLTEQDGKYSIVMTSNADGTKSQTKMVTTQDSIKFTTDELPPIALVPGYNNPRGVFPNRSFYIDAAEYPMFTAEAYRRFLAKQKKAETDEPSSSEK